MKYRITIKVDTNDADYTTEVSEIDKETVDSIRPLLKRIKDWSKTNPYESNFNVSEYGDGPRPHELYPEFSEELIETLESFCPWSEYGFHTIEEVYVEPAQERERLV